MRVARALVAAAAAGAVLAPPAGAHPWTGYVFGTSGEGDPQQLRAECTFVAETTAGTAGYVVGGTALATATGPTVAQVTVLTCTLVSPAQGVPGEQPTLTPVARRDRPVQRHVGTPRRTGTPDGSRSPGRRRLPSRTVNKICSTP